MLGGIKTQICKILGRYQMYHIVRSPKTQFASTYSSSLLKPTSRGQGGVPPYALRQIKKPRESAA